MRSRRGGHVRGGRAAIAGAVAVLAAIAFAGCGPSEERASDEVLRAAIERLRSDTSTDWGQRRLKLVAVEQILPATQSGRDAKDACVTAYRKLLDAEDAVTAAEQDIKMSQVAKAPVSPAALEQLVRAEEAVKTAREAMPACDAAAAKLAIAAR